MGMTHPEATIGNMTDWYGVAHAWVLKNVTVGQLFSGNDLWAAGLPNPGNRRLLGKVLLTLEREGFIRRSGTRDVSEGGHGQSIQRWQRVTA